MNVVARGKAFLFKLSYNLHIKITFEESNMKYVFHIIFKIAKISKLHQK